MTVTDPDLRPLDVLPAVADPDRLEALERTGLLDTPSDPTLDRFARLAAALLDAPVSFITLVGSQHQAMAGMVQTDAPDAERTMPANESFCQYAVATGEELVIDNTLEDPLVKDSPLVRRSEVLSYAGIPLESQQGHVLGTLCVIDRKPRHWTDEQLALLRDLTALVQRDIHDRMTLGRIAALQGLGQQLSDRLRTAGEAVTSLVELAEQHEDMRLQRYAALARSRFEEVTELSIDLRDASAETRGAPVTRVGTADVRAALNGAVASVRASTRTQALDVDITSAPLPVRCDRLALERAITHTLVSTLHHSSADGAVHVQLQRSENVTGQAGAGTDVSAAACLTVHAPGCRIPAAELARVVARLHQASTADGTGPEKPAALRATGGTVTAQSGPARGRCSIEGSSFRVRLPLHEDDQASTTIHLP